jgi:hypothetical protein
MIDECYSDADIVVALNYKRIRSASGAIAWARRTERTWRFFNGVAR